MKIMNVDDAIRAHTDWKVKLQAYVNGWTKERLEPLVIGRDNNCALGQWLCDGGRRDHGQDPLYAELCQAHTCFHKSASKIVEVVNAGKHEDAKALLNDREGDFAKHTQQVVRCLMVMRNKVK